MELGQLQEYYERIRALGVELFAVSVDPPEASASQALRRRLGLDFTFLCDPNGEVLDQHGDSCGCEGLDCETIPDPFPCQECHTDGCNGFISAEWQRWNCMYCHTGTGEPPDGPPPR